MFVTKREPCKFKALYNITVDHFCLGHVIKYFPSNEINETSWKCDTHDFPTNDGLTSQQNVRNIYEYLIKNNIKWILVFWIIFV